MKTIFGTLSKMNWGRIQRLGAYIFLTITFGGGGFWISFVQHRQNPSGPTFYNFLGNMGTFSISVAIMAYAYFLLLREKKYSATPAILLFAFTLVCALRGALAVFYQNPLMHYFAVCSTVLCIIEWLIIHWSDPTFESKNAELNPLGGEIS